MRIWGGCATEAGAVKVINQDRILFCHRKSGGESVAVGLVSDGISRMNRGEWAAQAVRDRVYRWFCGNQKEKGEALAESLEAVFQEANAWVRRLREDGSRIRSGATLSACLLTEGICHCYQVGDSRIYHGHSGRWEMVTEDQTVLVEKGSGLKACLYNYVGKDERLYWEKTRCAVTTGDVFLFCSDGFDRTMRQEDLAWMFTSDKGLDPNAACRSMIKKALSRGERDNISLGFFRVEGGEPMNMEVEQSDETEF